MDIFLNAFVEASAIVCAALIAAAAGILAYYRNRKHIQIGLAQALMVEIKLRAELAESSLGNWLDKVEQLLAKGEKPFLTIASDVPSVFRDVQRELYLLDSNLIEAVTRYHQLDQFVSISLSRIGTDDFMQLSQDRQKEYIENLQKLIPDYLASGQKATEVLNDYIQKLQKKYFV